MSDPVFIALWVILGVLALLDHLRTRRRRRRRRDVPIGHIRVGVDPRG